MRLRLYVNYALIAVFFILFVTTAIVIDQYGIRILGNLERLIQSQDSIEAVIAENDTVEQFADIYLPPEVRQDVREIIDPDTINSIMTLAFWASIAGAVALAYMATFGLAPMRRECMQKAP